MDLITISRSLIGNATYVRGANPASAPGIVDCSTYTAWVCRHVDVPLPRYARDQHAQCDTVIRAQLLPLDFIFFRVKDNEDLERIPRNHVAHVGIVVSNTHFVHAATPKLGVIEQLIDSIDPERFHSFGRLPALAAFQQI
ncbi:C40 family peptidase [Candidatus Uhrbacteria bacterium]|nr:C40 family peptidase [Candidatus Uhrbacteria bacterium]